MHKEGRAADSAPTGSLAPVLKLPARIRRRGSIRYKNQGCVVGGRYEEERLGMEMGGSEEIEMCGSSTDGELRATNMGRGKYGYVKATWW